MDWIDATRKGSVRCCLLLITLGCGAYGFTVGIRNGWEMGAYVAVKLPFILLITLLLNGLLNGLLGLVLGSGISIRKSLQFLLVGLAIMAVILGALSPISFFATLNMPSSGDGSGRFAWHGASLLMHTGLIAFAGITAFVVLIALFGPVIAVFLFSSGYLVFSGHAFPARSIVIATIFTTIIYLQSRTLKHFNCLILYDRIHPCMNLRDCITNVVLNKSLWIVLSYNTSRFHNRQSVTKVFGLFHIVSRQNYGYLLGFQQLNPLPNYLPGLRVKACSRFVQNEQLRFLHKGTGN